MAILALTLGVSANAAKKSIVLDLTQPSNPVSFEYDANGVWTETYNDADYTYWESQVFMFTHLIDGPGSSWGGIAWDGFTVSKNADATPADDLLDSQWGCMAGGGIADVVDDQVVVDSSRPYAIAYYSLMSMQNSLSITFNDGNTYSAEGMYVTTSPYVYYTTKDGYFVARAFTEEGDYLKIIAHGVKEDDSETTIEMTIAEFTNGEFSALDEWTWFDLSPLGEVKEIYFTMESTDVDPMWGMNTPGYFCMDRLTVSMEVEEDAFDGVMLDLTQPSNPETFEYDANGAWAETYNDVDYTHWDSQAFRFSHLISGPGSSYGGIAWNGFTVSKNASDQPTDYFPDSQWGCMAQGGIEAISNGTAIVNSERPYIVANYSSWETQNSLSITFNDGNLYTLNGMYVTNSPYPYYTNIAGDDFSNGLTNEGDYFKVIAHGVKADNTVETAEFILAEFKNGSLQQVTEWTWWDLSTLGTIKEVYFTMESTDVGQWGMNTPAYFCIDRIMASNPVESGIEESVINSNTTDIYYSANNIYVTSATATVIKVYSVNGVEVLSQMVGEGTTPVSTATLPSGIYVAKVGGKAIKFSK
jgi:hypothetical protein